MINIINYSIDIIDDFIEDKTINESSKKYLQVFYLKLKDLHTKYETADKTYTTFKEYIIESLKSHIYDNTNKTVLILKNSEVLERIRPHDFCIKYELTDLIE